MGAGGCLFWSYSLNMLKIHPKGAKNQSRVAEADSDFQYDVEATYCFLEVWLCGHTQCGHVDSCFFVMQHSSHKRDGVAW